MKNYISILAVLISILTFTSCKNKVSETITFQSTDSRIKILVSGQRNSSFDPWTMTVQQILSDTILAEASLESFVDEPTNENILVKWKTPSKAVLTFIEKDGTEQYMPVEIRF